MKIINLEPQKYKRLFTFGCSFTNYAWPTWADIISQDIPYFENWGRGGSGNFFIFNQFMEALEKNNFKEGDLVIIMWSHPRREDRYVNTEWIHAAGKERKNVYGKTWVKKFACDRGNLIRDLSLMAATQRILKSLKCDWSMLHMIPMAHLDLNNKDLMYLANEPDNVQQNFWFKLNQDLHNSEVSDLLENKDIFLTYKNVFSDMHESVWSVLNHGQSKRPFDDLHPTPSEALKYLETIFPNNTISDQTRKFVDNWENTVWKSKIDPNKSFRLYDINRL